MEDVWIETKFGNIFGKTAGEGPLVLGIHGWSQRNGWHTWEPLIAPLAAGGFRVVSVDMPGWGQSVPTTPDALKNGRAAEAVLAIIDSLGADRAGLMGKSWGGGVALTLALEQPERIDKLILTAPAFRQFDRLNSLAQPVLLAWAEDDSVIPIRQADKFVEAIPQVQLETYPDGGHSAAPKNAEQFAPVAIEFLQA